MGPFRLIQWDSSKKKKAGSQAAGQESSELGSELRSGCAPLLERLPVARVRSLDAPAVDRLPMLALGIAPLHGVAGKNKACPAAAAAAARHARRGCPMSCDPAPHLNTTFPAQGCGGKTETDDRHPARSPALATTQFSPLNSLTWRARTAPSPIAFDRAAPGLLR